MRAGSRVIYLPQAACMHEQSEVAWPANWRDTGSTHINVDARLPDGLCSEVAMVLSSCSIQERQVLQPKGSAGRK